ncbi:MAG: hypothetical protein R3F62_09670 [Planctomycetota bacterium]
MLRLALCASLLLAAQGCVLHTPLGDDDGRWPLVAAPSGQEPTLLIRQASWPSDLRYTGPLYDLDGIEGVAEGSRAFSQVGYQLGFADYAQTTDYTLDLRYGSEVAVEWYSYLGLIPGLPLVGHTDFSLACTVLDREHRELGTVEVQRRKTLAAWLVLAPCNLLLSPFEAPGTWAREHDLMVAGMLREALREADRRFALGLSDPQ